MGEFKMASKNLVSRFLLTTNQRNLMIISTRSASGGGNFKHSAEWHQITPNSERVGKWPYILKLMNIRTPFLDEKWTFGDAANEINHGNYYRKAPVITPKPLAFLAEIMAAIVWTYIWFNFSPLVLDIVFMDIGQILSNLPMQNWVFPMMLNLTTKPQLW